MPEGPELHLASKFVNACCKGRVFSGKIVKNPVHKSSDVTFEAQAYTVAAASRGKEMQLILTKLDCNSGDDSRKKANKKKDNGSKDKDEKTTIKMAETLKILFRFGMSGNFQFTTPDDIHKHSHLRFFTKPVKNEPQMVLSYVDVRRFGRWEVGADWSKNRGPDPMFEYQAFRSNVVKNMQNSAFDQPICETMLNQKFFNGIGNYLRAEILFRLGIPPFEKARTVLEGLSEEPPDVKPVKKGKGKGRKGEEPDILHLCHTVPMEVIAIGAGGYTADGKASDYSDFMKWLQCYYKDGMTNMVDHNGRTIWFTGPAGPMAPKKEKSRAKRSPKKRKQDASNDDVDSPIKSKKTEELDNDIAQKSTKKSSKPKAKTTSKGGAAKKDSELPPKEPTASKKAKVGKTGGVATSRARKVATNENESGDVGKKPIKNTGKRGGFATRKRKGTGDARTVQPTGQLQNGKALGSSAVARKKGNRNARIVDDSKAAQKGSEGGVKGRSRKRRVVSKK